MKNTIIILLYTLSSSILLGQSNQGIVEGRVINATTNEPLPFTNLVIWGTNIGSVSDLDGRFLFTGVKPGYIQIAASSVGFETKISEEFLVTNAIKAYIEIALNESAVEISAIVVEASPFRREVESPVSLQRIGIKQIEKNPGGNRDISRIIQTFPGVASTPNFRNDVIVRGGGPSENSFYLDGIEIPTLNHFSTQGASGGPVGIVNVDFIREVNLYTGAFPSKTGNTMSSVLDMRQLDGNKDKLKFKGSVGASDLALALDGPLTNNTTFFLSARRSYLQLLFSALELPFLPTYNDFQFKTKTRINDKNELTLMGIGAIDQFDLNTEVNETPEQRYVLSYLPVNEQWNYTLGAVYRHFRENGFDSWYLSRSHLNNISYKYQDNDENKFKTFDYSSQEIANKLRYERTNRYSNGIKTNVGISLEYAQYTNFTSNRIYQDDSLINFNYETDLDLLMYGFFGQISKSFLDNRLSASFGIRADANNYSSEMNNPLQQISPRLSVSYQLTQQVSVNGNLGRFYQRPPFTALGYKNNEQEYINRLNGLKYIQSDHLVGGIKYQPNSRSQLSVEGFYKKYSDYPFSVTDSVPLAGKGADFGTYGDEELTPVSKGRAYGLEVSGRSQDIFGFVTVLSYTYVRSEFRDERATYRGQYLPTAWDNRHLFNITATREFNKGWFFGFKWRYIGGSPYTPYDEETSSVKEAWDAQGRAYLDYSRYNEERLKAFQQLDVRVDKQYYFKKWSLNIYLDIQNLYNFKGEEPPTLVRKSFIDPDYDDLYVDSEGVERYELTYLESDGVGTILPTVGIIIEF